MTGQNSQETPHIWPCWEIYRPVHSLICRKLYCVITTAIHYLETAPEYLILYWQPGNSHLHGVSTDSTFAIDVYWWHNINQLTQQHKHFDVCPPSIQHDSKPDENTAAHLPVYSYGARYIFIQTTLYRTFMWLEVLATITPAWDNQYETNFSIDFQVQIEIHVHLSLVKFTRLMDN